MAPNDPKNGGGFFASPLCPYQLTVWLAMRDWILLIPKEVQRIQQGKQTEEDGSKRYIYFYREKRQHKKKDKN
uniref:Uncharacterized protein n=1 Tax=Noccaea caerulescens TaxID=107243 RepID=A0A1J3CXG7_NOCCA